MQIKKKKLLLILSFILLIFMAAGLGYRYLPLNKIMRMTTPVEKDFTGTPQSPTGAPNSIAFNFEPSNGAVTDGLYKGIAHSGSFSAKAFGKNSYSVAVERTVKEIGADNLGAIAVSAWVYLFPGKNDPLGNLVFAASDKKINVAWKSVTVKGPLVPRGKWFKISGFFDLSGTKFKPENTLDFYFWNDSNNDFLVDDLYIVFGGPQQRPGDSTLTDMTKNIPFTHRFNTPPYPVSLLEKEEISNHDEAGFISGGGTHAGAIRASDLVLPGHFFHAAGPEEILVMRQSEKPVFYSFHADKKAFSAETLSIPPDCLPLFTSGTVLKGRFIPSDKEMLLITGKTGSVLASLETGKSGPSANTGFKVRWRTNSPMFGETGQNHLLAADLNGHGTEVIEFLNDGGWKISAYSPNDKSGWTVKSSGKDQAVPEWNTLLYEVKTFAGHFLPGVPGDVLLTVFKEKGKKDYRYTLHRFDPVTSRFVSCFPEKQGRTGKTIGIDTLKPGDQFLCVNSSDTKNPVILRYNRDWRYDLKEIRFNDTTFEVIANLDFHGYEGDHNPKYSEALRLCPFEFTGGITGILTVGENRKEKDYNKLPGMLEVYTLRKRDNQPVR